MIVCPECKKELQDGAQRCDGCGRPLDVAEKGSDLPKVTFLTLSPKTIRLCGIALALLLVVAFLLPEFFGVPSGFSGGVLFVKDDLGCFMDLDRQAVYPISDCTVRLAEGRSESHASETAASRFSALLSPDGDTLFYTDDYIDDGDCILNVSLYMRSLKEPSQKPIKIDSQVQSFHISSDGKLLTYTKGTHHEVTLWRYDFKSKEMIVPGRQYEISSDRKNVFYLRGGDIYVNAYGRGAQLIDSDVEGYYDLWDDDTVVYQQKNTLYRYTVGGEKEAIATDVQKLLRVYEGGRLYYTKGSKSSETLKAVDFFIDDMKEADSALVQPIEPVAPKRADYKTQEDYEIDNNLYNQRMAKYKIALRKYNEKLTRDNARAEISETTVYVPYNDTVLCYYDGKTEIKLSDGFTEDNYVDGSYDYPCIFFNLATPKTVSAGKVVMSQVEDPDEITNAVNRAMQRYKNGLIEKGEGKEYLAFGASLQEVGSSNVSDFALSEDGRNLYFVATAGGSIGTLYASSIDAKGNAQKPTVYDTFVYRSVGTFEDKPVYMKNPSDKWADRGDLYIGKEKIDTNVSFSWSNTRGSGELLYRADYDKEKKTYTLKSYAGGKVTEIAEDISGYIVGTDGQMFFFTDYDAEKRIGDLYIYDHGDTEKLSDGVCAIDPVLRG